MPRGINHRFFLFIICWFAFVLSCRTNKSTKNEPELERDQGLSEKRAAEIGLGLMLNPAEKHAAQRQADPNVHPHGERYIVKFKKPVAGANALSQAKAYVALALPKHKAVSAYIPEAALAGLKKNPNIEYIERDPIRMPFGETTPYGIPMVQADQVSDASAANTNVCIIDSGYYAAHEDLQNTHVTSTSDSGTGNPLEDGCGHGTHVAGTVAALTNGKGVVGVNPSGQLNLHIVKVFGNDCNWAYASAFIKALDACQTLGGRVVVNMSLGGPTKSRTEERAFIDANNAGVLSIAAAGNDGNTRKSYPASYNSVVSVAAIDANKVAADFSQKNSQVELAAPGVGVLSTVPWLSTNTLEVNGVTYQGNHIENATYNGGVTGALADGGLCNSTGSWSGAIVLCERGEISFFDKVVNVQNGGGSATVIYNNVTGNFLGTLGDGNSSSIPAISISQEDGQTLKNNALGVSSKVVSVFSSPGSGYEAWDGTSMATPHVVGVAALVWSNHSSATNQQLRDALANTAEDLGEAGRDNFYGFGLVQAKAALDYLVNGPTCTPTESSETSCSDGADNDCDGLVDIADPDCEGSGGGSCDLGQVGEFCTVASDCCSNKCKGKPGSKRCK